MVQSGHEQEMLGSPSGLMVPNDLAAMGANSPHPYDYFIIITLLIQYMHTVVIRGVYICSCRYCVQYKIDNIYLYIYIDWIR